MTPIEKLEAAIAEMEEQYAHSPFGGDLEVVDREPWFYVVNKGTDLSDYTFGNLMTEDRDEADLLVLLHRTISIQLRLLYDALECDRPWKLGNPGYYRREIELADAILGTTS